MTVAKPRRRKPAAPAVRAPKAGERERMERAKARADSRSHPVTVAFAKGAIRNPHDDPDGWFRSLDDALGSNSPDFVIAQLNMLTETGRPRGEREKIAEPLNANLALVEAIAPQNELEAALAVQMAGVHNLAGEMLGRAKQTDRMDYVAIYGGLAVKLARTFTAQVEALARLRGGGKQQIEVQHVHVNGNAVVGNVTTGGGGAFGNPAQPHAPGLAFAPGEAVPCSFETHGESVPIAGGERQEPVSNARRG